MIDKRYQVFISTSGADMQPERIVLAQTLTGMGYFSWGLEQRTPLSTSFARRQIDDCDYVVVLLGSHYGELSVSGVSYFQLEYLYAKQQQKPMIVFMHARPEERKSELQEHKPELQTKFQDFRAQLLNEVDLVFQYRTLRELELAIRSNMPQLVERCPALGWVRPQPEQELNLETEQLKQRIEQLEQELGKKQADPFLDMPKVAMHDFFAFDYRAHVYQDGNLTDLRMNRRITWAQLLTILGPVFKTPSPEDYFARKLNEYLNAIGLKDAQMEIPRAHAISRAQINIRALHNIKLQMKYNDWITPIGRDDRQRMLWATTNKAEKLLASNLLDTDRLLQSSSDQ